MTAILFPVFVMVLLTTFVAINLAYRRVKHLRKNRIHPQSAPTRAEAMPLYASSQQYSDNLQNLFEFPVLFYVLVVMLLVTQKVDAVFVGMAWGYAALRVVHSYIHCRYNKVTHRFYVFILSVLLLVIMWTKFFIALL